MKRIIFCTNLPSPYRVDFFNELAKHCELIVLYERYTSSERNSAWKGNASENYEEVYLDLKLVGVDRSKGSALKDYIKIHQSDILVFTNYVSPATIEAIIWCRLHGRKYYIEYDGGFNKRDPFVKGILKKFLLKGATGHLTTSDEHIMYLQSIGIVEKRIYKYPFTSVSNKDIKQAQIGRNERKEYYRKLLNIEENIVVIAVGQFIHRKGFDLLLKAASRLDKGIGIYIIGGEPTEEYIKMKESMKLANVNFVGFKTKKELTLYYQAADCTAFPTREDIWGLITNESMSFGVPVVATNRCISALEMIKEGKNGYIIPIDNDIELAEKILLAISKCSYQECVKMAMNYTIETMVSAHVAYFKLN